MRILSVSALLAASLLATGCEPVDDDGDSTTDPTVVDRGVDLDQQTPPSTTGSAVRRDTVVTDQTPDPDNTDINDRDASGDTVTPEDQPNRSEDVQRLATLRQRVLEIENLSINGQNIKMISQGDKVVLRGPVQSQTEREAIVAVARDVVGADNVIDELEVNDDQ